MYESYSFDLEHEFPWGVAFKIGYVGGHGRNLPNSYNINQLADSNYNQGATALGSPVANQYAGFGSFRAGTVKAYQTLLPFPQYQAITDSVSIGRSDYNALDVKVQKRLSRGLTLLMGYTWSSNWDNIWGAYGSSNTINPGNNGPQDIYNVSSEYARATNDIPNRFTVAATYELPFGHGKQFLATNRLLDFVVGGWRFNDVMILQNGGPMALTQSTNSLSAYGNGTQRPLINPAGGSACLSGSPESRLGGVGNTPYFNPRAFTGINSANLATGLLGPAGLLQYGNQPRASNCYGPGYANSDLSLNKDFRMTEKVHVEFRAEALNAFNTPQFNGPNLAVDSAAAGQITGTLGFPRLIQLGGRLTF